MSLFKSPWFWGSTALGLLFMNSRSKADELKQAAPTPPASPPRIVPTTPASPKKPPAPPKAVPGAESGGKATPGSGAESGGLAPGQGAGTFVTPSVPKGAKVVTEFVEGRAYTVAQLGGGEYLVISQAGDAYDKFGQNGDIESAGRTPAALALLQSDMQRFEPNLFDKMQRGGGV